MQPMAEALEAGHVLVRLHGEKIRGGYPHRTSHLKETVV